MTPCPRLSCRASLEGERCAEADRGRAGQRTLKTGPVKTCQRCYSRPTTNRGGGRCLLQHHSRPPPPTPRSATTHPHPRHHLPPSPPPLTPIPATTYPHPRHHSPPSPPPPTPIPATHDQPDQGTEWNVIGRNLFKCSSLILCGTWKTCCCLCLLACLLACLLFCFVFLSALGDKTRTHRPGLKLQNYRGMRPPWLSSNVTDEI